MKNLKTTFVSLVAITIVSVAVVAYALPKPAGRIVLATGKSSAVSPDGKTRALKRGGPFYEGDTIETEKKSYVKLKYTDGGIMLLRPATTIVVEKYMDPKKGVGESVTSLLKGGMRAVTGAIAKRDNTKYKMKTPTATMGVRGTDFTLRVCNGDCGDLVAYGAPAPDDGLYAAVNGGAIDLSNNAGTRRLNAGQFGYVKDINFKPKRLKDAPAIIAVDNLPSPRNNNNEDFIEGNECK